MASLPQLPVYEERCAYIRSGYRSEGSTRQLLHTVPYLYGTPVGIFCRGMPTRLFSLVDATVFQHGIEGTKVS